MQVRTEGCIHSVYITKAQLHFLHMHHCWTLQGCDVPYQHGHQNALIAHSLQRVEPIQVCVFTCGPLVGQLTQPLTLSLTNSLYWPQLIEQQFKGQVAR